MKRDLARALAALCLVAGCGDDDTSPTPPSAIEGTATIFEVDADWSESASFYDFPFPSDLRLTAAGTADVAALPYGDDAPIFPTVFPALERRPGFAVQPAAWFRFDGAMPRLDEEAAIPADAAAPVLLIDVDPESPRRGALHPVSARVHEADGFNPENLLAVGAYPGVMLYPGRRYAFVVMRSLNDAAGEPLGVPASMVALAAGATPVGARGEAVAALYAPLWETLDSLDVDRAAVAAATVFTPGDVVRQNLDESEALLAKYDVTIEDVALDPDDGVDHARFCELHGAVVLPQFQKGARPYNAPGEGVMEVDEDGVPVEVRQETVPIALTIPKGPMPVGGYPLVFYIHGSGGLSTQVVDRGRIPAPGADETKGEGPAHVVAEHGFATFGAAMPFNPQRDPAVGAFDYANQVNFSAFPFNFRQGVYEQRLLIEALTSWSIAPSALAGCDGPSLPNGETAYRFNMDAIMLMGQSMGGQYTNLLAAIEPRGVALTPTGSGSFSARFLMVSPFFGGVKQIVAQILAVPQDNISHLHPGVQAVHTAWEAGDAMPSLPRQSLYPFEGHPVRSVYTPVSEGDQFFPTTIFNAMALAWRTQQAGDVVWPSMQTDMALVGTDGIAEYPVANNRVSESGEAYTAVVVQYPGDGIADPHTIFSQLDEVKYQYGCFLSTLRDTKTATVPAPAAFGTACAE